MTANYLKLYKRYMIGGNKPKGENMRYKNKEMIRKRLVESFETGEGIHTKATSMGSGFHHWWLTGTEDSYRVHCYGRGQGWSDQSDDTRMQNLEELVGYLWKKRASIREESI